MEQYEHMIPMAATENGRAETAETIMRIFEGTVGKDFQQSHRKAKMTALNKPGGGIRPIACAGAHWRQASKGAAVLLAKEVRESEIGQYQYATGATGAQMYHRINAVMEKHKSRAIFSLDLKNAFNSIQTRQIYVCVGAKTQLGIFMTTTTGPTHKLLQLCTRRTII